MEKKKKKAAARRTKVKVNLLDLDLTAEEKARIVGGAARPDPNNPGFRGSGFGW
jgi:hypothetical protein